MLKGILTFVLLNKSLKKVSVPCSGVSPFKEYRRKKPCFVALLHITDVMSCCAQSSEVAF